MGIAELTYHFLQALKTINREQQIQAFTFMSSVGSFFAKNHEKTVIEQLSENIQQIDKVLGKEKEKKKIDSEQLFSKIFGNLQPRMNLK